MLKELSHIARDMLFLQGHLTRPQDWAETSAESQVPETGKTAPSAKDKAPRAQPKSAGKANAGFFPGRVARADGCH